MTDKRILVLSLMAFGLIAAGCSPRNVEMLTLDGPSELETNQSGTFTAAVNEDAKPPVEFSWDFGDDGTASGTEAEHAFANAGTYEISVTASNRKGKASVTEGHTVVVSDPPVPAEIVAVIASATSADTQTPVEFSANVRGDAPLTYAWSFGDGNSSDSPRTSHTYMQDGSYSVTLELSNEHGRDARSVSVDVSLWQADFCDDLAEMNSTFFERNSSVLTESGMEQLADNLDILTNSCPYLIVSVEGLAGPFERNPQDLSDDRARAVMQYYVDNGVEARRVSATGLGRAPGGSKKSGAEQFRRADTKPVN